MGEQKKDGVKTRKKRETKSRGFYMRMSKTEIDELDYYSYEFEESKTDMLRKGLKMYLDFKRNAL